MAISGKEKILIIGWLPPPFYGPAVATERLVHSEAMNRQFEILFLNQSDKRDVKNAGKFDLLNILFALWHIAQFIFLVIWKRPELIYVPISQSAGGYLRDGTYLLIARALGKKSVVHLRGSNFRKFYENSSRLMRQFIKASLKRVRRTIVLGESIKPIFDGLVKSDSIVVVPNGLNIAPFQELQPQKKSGNSQIKVLYLSTLMREKGGGVLLRAIPLVLKETQEVKFIFVGDWFTEGFKQECLDYISQNRIGEYIEFKGFTVGEAKVQMLFDADIFVFPPIAPEGMPWVLLEAMTAELPIISTPQGTIPEVVVDGETGFIVESGNAEALAEKIMLLIRDEQLRRQMGKKGKERLMVLYTEERYISNLAKVFHDVLSEP